MHVCYIYRGKRVLTFVIFDSLLCQKIVSSYESKTHPYQAKHCQVTSETFFVLKSSEGEIF